MNSRKTAFFSTFLLVPLVILFVIAACQPTNSTNPPSTPTFKPCNGTQPCFLSKKVLITDATASIAETNAYYQTIDPPGSKSTLQGFWQANGFTNTGGGGIQAIYFNNGDLRIGRDMNCKQNGSDVACFVTNYGPPPAALWTPNSGAALADAVAAQSGPPASGHTPFATVAMEYHANLAGAANEVTFYIYNAQQARIPQAVLDGEGAKSVPQMCMSCHGGSYNPATHSATGISFLPFDLNSFEYSSAAAWTQSAQAEKFRQLNAIVRSTNPNHLNANNPIVSLIDGWYSNNVNTPNTAFNGSYVPPGWDTPDDRAPYQNVIAIYCRSCHIASQTFDFTNYTPSFTAIMASVRGDVCNAHTMPDAEVPYLRLWVDAGGFPALGFDG